jgi:uncharacterized membrane protein YczE
MRSTIIHFLEMLFGITILSAGITLGIIAGLGQTTSTAACSAISAASGIKVGTAMMFVYSFFLLLQLLVLRRNFRPKALLELIPVVLQGWILNFFKYDFAPFQHLAPQGYLAQLLVFVCGMVLISLGFTVVKCSRFENYPPESFCALMAERTGIRFGTAKIILDFIYVALTLLLCGYFHLEAGIVREGTIIFAIFNGQLINLFLPHVEKYFSLDKTSLSNI